MFYIAMGVFIAGAIIIAVAVINVFRYLNNQ